MLIIIYINYGIQYLLDFLKNAYIIFSLIENFGIPNIIHFILRNDKKNYSIKEMKYMFFSATLISTDIEAPYYEKAWNQLKSDALKKFGKTLNKKKRLYSIEEKILHIKRYYYYVSYFYNEDVKKYYEKYGLIFLYFSLYIPDLIYYISDNKNFNKEMNTQSNQGIEMPKRDVSYAKKIQYLFTLTDDEIKKKSIAVIDEFMPKFIDYIKKIEYSNYTIFRDNKNLNIDKLYKNIMDNINKGDTTQYQIKEQNYTSTNNSTNNSTNSKKQQDFNKLIELITEPVHFESNEKAIATISGIPEKFDKNLVSPHFFAFDFNLDKIKEVCSNGLMKFSKAGCFEFIKLDIKNVFETVNFLFNKTVQSNQQQSIAQTDIWKFFVDIQVSLIKEGFVFASQEINILIYISRLFGSSFDSILEIFYQSFPYFMFCFEYINYIKPFIGISELSPCNTIQYLYNKDGDTIGLEKMIILYKYLNITNIEVMEYIKKYGIIFLIYALFTPFYICQTELNRKNITLHTQIIIDTLKAMDKFELIKRVKLVFDDTKIVEFIKKVENNKNSIFGKLPFGKNNSNSHLNVNKFSNNLNKYNGNTYNRSKRPQLLNMVNTEPNGKNADFIWSVFTVPVQ
jgi:hypothetical protein